MIPDDVAVNADSSKLFVTDTPFVIECLPPGFAHRDAELGVPNGLLLRPRQGWIPSEQAPAGIAKRGIPDDIKVDDAG